jgi:hypothetical protein
MAFAVPLLAAIAAVLSYRLFDVWTGRSWIPAGLRALGWAGLALLLVNASCPAASGPSRPIVLLDGSLSMGAAGARWSEALGLARGLGEVRVVGGRPGDSIPTAGRSQMAPAVLAAQATGRPVILVTDGELEDGEAILAGPAIPEIRVLPRAAIPDLAITRVGGTTRIAPGDTLRLEVELLATGGGSDAGRRVDLQVREGSRTWIRGIAVLDSGGRARVSLAAPVPGGTSGVHPLSIAITNAGDREPRTDLRSWVVHVVPTPGVVLLASPPSWESRFLLATLRDVAAVPVRGYLETEPGSWRRAGDLMPASPAEVAEAVRKADLLVTLGTADRGRATRARARWIWPRPSAAMTGDWYVSPGPGSPVSGALTGLAVDSFPPGTALAEATPSSQDWVGLSAQLGRRGAVKAVLFGRDSTGIRRAVTGIEGLWRWAFRGGSSEQGYRAIVASTVTWLLGGSDSVSGRARPQREVISQGMPAVFEWAAGDNPVPIGVDLMGEQSSRRDTLHFDGSGRAALALPPGTWRYRLEGGGEGVLVVEQFSEELLPHPVTVADRPAAMTASASRRPVRGWIWLFALAVAAFAGEWTVRRRLGLR